jgi:hypothetical protein
VDLYGFLHSPQIPGNLLVSTPRNCKPKYFQFSWRQRLQSGDHGFVFRPPLSRLAIPLDGAMNSGEQFTFSYGLREKIDSYPLHCLYAIGDISILADEDYWPQIAGVLQDVLQLKAIQARHGKIQHRATRHRKVMVSEEIMRRKKRAHLISSRTKQPRKCAHQARLAIYEEDYRLVCDNSDVS